ncbi:MAG: XRE family transcriptional regulator [Fimbriimonas sp.]
MPPELLGEERDVEELIRAVTPEVVGARLARARRRLGLSIRELAAAANVNKNSILRLEKGGAPHPMTVLKLCAAMNLHLAALAKPSGEEDELVTIHRHGDDRWYDMTDFGAGPVADRPLTPEERQAQAERGLVAPMLILTNRLERGQLLPNVLELYGPSAPRSHKGEEMVYVLEGRVRIVVGAESFELDAGESATFWSSEVHQYLPAEGAELPVRLLSVTIQHRP